MRSYRAFSWFTLAFCVAVILWGAYVRATGSGAGCGRHWPLCNGEVIPLEPQLKTMIEFSHRLSSGISLLLVIGLFVWTRRLFPKGSFQRKIGALAFLAIVLEALVGAMLVLMRYVELDQSVGRAVSISLHLVNTLFLLATLTIVAFVPSEAVPRWSIPEAKLRLWTRCLLAGFVFLGALGALTALGDTLFPVSQRSESESRHFLEQIRIFHPIAALAWFGALWPWASHVSERFPGLKPRAVAVVGIAAANLLLGLTNVLMQAPVGIQILHLLVADILWILLVSLVFSAASRWQ